MLVFTSVAAKPGLPREDWLIMNQAADLQFISRLSSWRLPRSEPA